MRTSIIIPVWNGVDTIVECLAAVYNCGTDHLHEVICVDNSSSDSSAQLITEGFPQTKLLRQPINLGFSGGVNAGIDAAQGYLLVLLNQDCIVEPGWLDALVNGLSAYPDWGIAGGTILTSEGAIHHSGAMIQRPLALGVHQTEDVEEPGEREYVTGALFAIRRAAWEQIGHFDEGFYPGYYEESDYCYRARRHGIGIGYLPTVRARHLFSSREWQRDPLRHAAVTHRGRYRFVVKHFSRTELTDFFDAESQESVQSISQEDALGRMIAARDILHRLSDIGHRRNRELGEQPDSVRDRMLQNGFRQLVQSAFAQASRQSGAAPLPKFTEEQVIQPEIPTKRTFSSPQQTNNVQTALIQRIEMQLAELQSAEHSLLRRLYSRPDTDSGKDSSRLQHLLRLVKRSFSILIGREFILRSHLSEVRAFRLDLMVQLQSIQHELLNELGAKNEAEHQTRQAVEEGLAMRLRLHDLMVDYDSY